MKTVAQLLQSKPNRAVHSVAPDAPVFEAIKLMAQHRIGALLVMDGERLAGIITERDYARKVVLMGRSSSDTPVQDIMTAAVLHVGPQQTNEHCMALMTEKRLRHLPVVADGRVEGMISIGDLVKDIISEQQLVIQQLEHYISGEHR